MALVIRPNPTLPDDLISEILVRVPVKSLLCFQSVCKTWLSLIKDPDFIKAQLLRAITIETDQTLIMTRFKRHVSDRFVLLDVDSRQIVTDFNFPYSRDEFTYEPDCSLVGSANGIVCVSFAVYLSATKGRLYLWNPATRQSKVIPTFRDFFREALGLGFGYDPVDQDYKVVRIGRRPNFSKVYSANRNVWRKVPDPIDDPLNGDFDVCVNGFLYGIGEYGMMTFDLNKEVLNCAIKLPFIYVPDDDYHAHDDDDADDDDETRIIESNDARIIKANVARIIEFNKSIAVITMRDTSLDDLKKINMWTLDDDACLCGGGVEASWTLMFSIDLGMRSDILHGYFSNGDLLIIMENAYPWFSYNIDKKEAKIVPLSVDMARYCHTRNIYKYTESLVSVAGFKQVDWNAGEDDD